MRYSFLLAHLKLTFCVSLVVFSVRTSFAQPSCPPSTTTRVQLLGDSWTHIMWNNRTYKDVFDQFGFADKIERGNNTAIGGTTANYWAQPGNLAVIQSELQQNPSVDIVLISIGGNDMLAGINGAVPGWHTGLNSTDEALLFDRIEADIQTMVNAIKGVRPNIEIVFSGYDYINLLETVINSPPTALLWANLGQPTPLQVNSAFIRFEQRKINIANADPRVHYVQGFGLMQFVYGYPGFFPAYSVQAPGQQPPGFLPYPGGDPNWATPPIALAAGGTDAIHLSDEGYKHLVVNQTSAYFWNKFRGNPNASFKSEGGNNDGWVRSNGNLGVGSIRVGDNGSSDQYRGIVSFNTGAIPDNATITGASLFINRASLSGSNPFGSGSQGSALVDVKTGTFGGAGIEITDYFSAADAADAGCFIGTAPNNGYTIRIDFKPNGYSKISKTGQTQFRIYFQIASGSGNDYVSFNNGDQPGLLAPYLDVYYTVPPPPATAAVSGGATICPGTSTVLNVSLAGTSPWTITWSDGMTQNITSSSYTRTVSPASTTTYQIVSVSDVNGPGSATGSVLIEVLPSVQVTVTGLASNYCANSPIATLFASPPGGLWTGAGMSGNIFNPALAVVQTGGGLLTLNYSGVHNSCSYSKNFSVIVDSNSCSQTGSCTFSPVTGNVVCVGTGPITKTYVSSGRNWVFEDLIPGKTYVASTCDSCGYDSHLMIRDENDSTFIAENDDACSDRSSVTFVAPISGNVGINLTGDRSFDCNGYPCNPHNCNPYNCNPYNCNPYQCNCQTCYQTCYQDEQVFMTCYPGGVQIINGLLTSDCIGACTVGYCWRIQYQVPYDCNPYQCNCQTCYQTCYDTCYQTCYDTCYQTCYDKCGTDNFIPCDVKLECLDCDVPVATIAASTTNTCEGDSVSFSAVITGMTCNTTYSWNFGTDGIPTASTDLNPQNVKWSSGGVKQVSFQVTEPGFGSDTFYLALSYNAEPSGGVVNAPIEICANDTARLALDSVQNASGYYWEFSGGYETGSGNFRDLLMPDSAVQFFVVAYNGVCEGDTFFGNIQSKPSPTVSISALGNTSLCPGESVTLTATSTFGAALNWQKNGQNLGISGNAISVDEDGIYRVKADDTSGCTGYSNEIPIVEYPSPTGSLIGNTDGCEGDTITLEADYFNASGYQWFVDGFMIQGAQDSILHITTAGSYLIAVTNSFCADSSNALQVSFHPLPEADAGDDVRICESDSVHLTASGGGDYFWNTGSTSATITVSPNQHTIYSVQVTGSHGCSDSDSVEVSVLDNPAPPSLAVNGNTVSTQGNYSNYQWFLDGVAITGANENSYEISSSGNYQVEVTDSNGCSAISSTIFLTLSGVMQISEGIKIYPNPVNDKLIIESKHRKIAGTISLFNVLGEEIYLREPEHSTLKIEVDLSVFSAGIYFLRINDIGMFKIVKE